MLSAKKYMPSLKESEDDVFGVAGFAPEYQGKNLLQVGFHYKKESES